VMLGSPVRRLQASPRKTRRLRAVDWKSILDLVIALAAFTAAWQVVFWFRFYPPYLLPSPAIVLDRFVVMVEDGQLGQGVAVTLGRIIAGFSLAVGLGIGVGMLMVSFKRFGRIMNSFSVGLQSFPSIAWVPFAILLVGLNDLGIIFVMVISSVFSMMVSTYSGIRNIPPIYVKAARNMGTRGVSLFRNVMLPASLPSLITGLRQAWSFAWHALIGAEILMATVGLGALLEFGAQFVRMDQIIASMVTIFVIGLAADRLIFSRLEEGIRSKRGLVQHSA
jgi:NitT/TauT family transport system permease protein